MLCQIFTTISLLATWNIPKEMIFIIKLINGDCLEEMKKLAEENVKVDLVLTDLPYGTTNCKWDTIIPLKEMWDCLNRLVYDKTPIVLFSQQPFTSKLVSSNYKWFKHEWIYVKKRGMNFATLKYAPSKVHENVLVFCKKTPNYYPIKEPKAESSIKREKYDIKGADTKWEVNNLKTLPAKANSRSKLRYPISVRYINNLKRGDVGLHPTQKPVEFLEYLIKTYSNEGDTVLDFTMGSGSTGVACLETNRKFIGIELDKDYYNIASERIRESEKQRKLI